MGGPPVQPPTVPTVSSIPQDQADTGGLVAALPRLVFNVEQQLSTLARILPAQSEQLNGIRESLRAVLASALQRGAGGGPPSSMPMAREGMETAIP
jgi:hypothetical protein